MRVVNSDSQILNPSYDIQTNFTCTNDLPPISLYVSGNLDDYFLNEIFIHSITMFSNMLSNTWSRSKSLYI